MHIKNYLIIFILFVGNLSMFAQLKSGMIIQGGIGHISNVSEVPGGWLDEIIQQGGSKTTEYFFNASLGYKFRIEPANKIYFYDIDWAVGLKRINYKYSTPIKWETDESGITYGTGGMGAEGHNAFYYMSINPSYNYRFYRKFSGGIGIEPLIYFKDGADDKWKFDCPLTFKLGYDLKYIGFSLHYKVGFANIMKSPRFFASGSLNDIQLQMFIPF